MTASSRLNLLRPNEQVDATYTSRVFDTTEALLNGRSRNRGTLTLTANVTSTDVKDARFQSSQSVVLCPMTANAATAVATTYVSARTTGQFTLTHANTATTDRTFEYIFVG
jgi:hypothetical protein